jgi:hypothetical protein
LLTHARRRCVTAADLGAKMEFTALFLAVTIVMIVAWRGPRSLALGLFAAVLMASVATYLHHATDTLKLSF